MLYTVNLRQKWETPKFCFEPGVYEVPDQMSEKAAQRVLSMGIATKTMPELETKEPTPKKKPVQRKKPVAKKQTSEDAPDPKVVEDQPDWAVPSDD